MAIKVRLDHLNGKRLGREKRLYIKGPYRKSGLNISLNNLASKIADEIFGEVSEPFIKIYRFLEKKGKTDDEITEMIFAERDKLFELLEKREFDRAFHLKSVGRMKGESNGQTPKYSKSVFFSKLTEFISSYYYAQGEFPTRKLAAKHLGYSNERALKRARLKFDDKLTWQLFCKNVLKEKR